MFTKGNADIFKGLLTFFQQFLLLKNGGWILFVCSLLFGFWYTGREKDKSKEEGRNDAILEIKSMEKTLKNNDDEIFKLNGRVAFYKSKLDSCETSRYDDKASQYKRLENEVNKAYEMALENQQRYKNDLK